MLVNELVMFVQIVKAGSLTKAAKQLHCTPAAVSKALARLEAHYQLKLINRTTRTINLTEYGNLLYHSSASILDTLNQAEIRLQQASQLPQGRIRLAAPVGFSKSVLSKILPQFLELHPNISIELAVDNRREFPEVGEYDLILKAGNKLSSHSGFRGKRLAQLDWVICASSSYLEKHGIPQTAQQLSSHICIDYNYRESGKIWLLKKKTKINNKYRITKVKVKNRSNLDTSAADYVIEHASNGGGIILMPRFAVQNHLDTGQLISILADYFVDPINIYLFHSHQTRHLPHKLRVLMAYLTEKIPNALLGRV